MGTGYHLRFQNLGLESQPCHFLAWSKSHNSLGAQFALFKSQ
jgi:hypothetical protein